MSRVLQAFTLLSFLTTSAASLNAADAAPSLKLPDTAAPTSYQAELKLSPDETTFSGHITIQANVKEPLGTLWLNANNISVSKATVSSGGKTYNPQTAPHGDDFLGLTFESPLPAGTATIDIEYTGKLRLKDSSGVFRMEEDGNRYIFTQFEETDARAAFPCFDEPSYKVPWQLTLEVPDKYDAVSNTPVEKQESRNGGKTIHFKQTKPLPSYLVAFAVGQFDFVPAGYAGKNRAPVRIVTPKGHANEAKYAAEVTATILTRLEDYFGIPFPYEKSDQVAIPNTYGFGAMENAGMVTYAQNILLGNPEHDAERRRRVYASVAAHELSHQWFGDLVTTAWWNDIWLNEAFATWMEQKLIADWKPEWKTRIEDADSKLRAESQDTLISSRKIRQEIKTKDDISNAFDGITYQKGAAVIGMFENWVGDSSFQRGVQNYLRKYAFRNATAPEFLAAVSSSIGKDIAPAFSTFLNQPGVPLVSANLDCTSASPVLHLQQQRSLPIGTEGAHDEHWQIPVCIRYGNGAQGESACTLMSDPREDWKIKSNGCPAWVEMNSKAVGYYRVAYDSKLLTALTEGDVATRLDAPERVDLMGNEQALATTGKIKYSEALSLVPVFHDDAEHDVVERAISVAGMPDGELVPDDLRPNYQRFIIKDFGPRAHELGWLPKPGEGENARLLRPEILPFVADTGGDKQLADEARTLTDKWLTGAGKIPADDEFAVLQTAAYYGNKQLFDSFLTKLKKTTELQERRNVIAGMEAFRDPEAIKAGMEAVLKGDIPFIEGGSLLYAGQASAKTRMMAFDFMKAHVDELASKRPTGAGADAGAYFVRVGASFCDAQSESELKSFFEPRLQEFTGAPRVFAQTLERIHSCIETKDAQESDVEQFLRGF